MVVRALYPVICALMLTRNAEAIENQATNNIGEFVGQLTSLLNQGVLQGGYPGGVLGGGYQSGGYPGLYPPFNPGRPLPPPPPGRPYPPPGQFPAPYQQYPTGYPGQGLVPSPTSLIGALSSIARYDDLRCVPRLLCEVASGTRPGSYTYPSYTQESPLPFLSKDALVTLLTVLNFVDDSPLLVFGRAALLGYTARGDSRACLIAYPTCPRDPDRLVDYLNNHNGGFFRFFNQQIPQYAPQYQQYQQQYPPPYPPPYPAPYPPQRPPPYPPQGLPYPQRPYPGYPQQYSSQNQRYQSRIQTRPESILEYNYYTSLSTASPQTDDSNRLTFSSFDDQSSTKDFYFNKDSKNKLVFPQADDAPQSKRLQSSRGGKGLAFPSESSSQDSDRLPFVKPVTMVFPDRTGTGDLRLDLDEYGDYKTVYYESIQHRDQRQKMHFPQ